MFQHSTIHWSFFCFCAIQALQKVSIVPLQCLDDKWPFPQEVKLPMFSFVLSPGIPSQHFASYEEIFSFGSFIKDLLELIL